MVLGIKITKDNFEKLLDRWVDRNDKKVAYVDHVQYLSFTQLADYAYVHNIVIKDKEISGPFRKVTFEGELLEI